MSCSSPYRRRVGRSALCVLFVVLVAVAASPFGPTRPVAAQPPAADQLPTALRYVPHDAALFLYVDAARVWSHEVTKSFRAADKSTLEAIEQAATNLSGTKAEDLKSVVAFMPSLKGPQDGGRVGFVLTFTKAFDKKKLETGLAGQVPQGMKLSVSAPDDKTALILLGLGDEYAKPKRPDADGPLASALASAASGKHVLVAGATFASLPDEIRKDDLPSQVRVFQPIFHADSLTATVDLGTALDVTVRVKTKRAAQAVDAEKALAAVTKLISEALERERPDIEAVAAKDPGMKDLITVLNGVVASVKDTKFKVDGTEARASATLPLKDLPLVAAYTAATQRLKQAAAAQRSANNLKQIGLAMHNYHDVNGAFPPAAVCDKKGRPQLSWRVLILPYLEQEALYKQFKLDEPWDSEHNKKLIAKMPQVYAIPGTQKPGATETYYRVFVGNGAGFDWLTGTKIANITDGTSNTFMCATGATAVPWTKPDELEFDPAKDPSKLMGMVVDGKAQVAMFDGSVRTLSKLPSADTLRALITRSGGEVVGDDF